MTLVKTSGKQRKKYAGKGFSSVNKVPSHLQLQQCWNCELDRNHTATFKKVEWRCHFSCISSLNTWCLLTKVWAGDFLQKSISFHFFFAYLWGLFYIGGRGGSNDHLKIKPWSFRTITGGFFLEINSEEFSKVVSCSVSLMLSLTWGINMLFGKLTPEIGVEFEKHPLNIIPLGVGISCKACLFKYIYWWPALRCLDYRASLDLPNYWSDAWRRYKSKGGSLVCQWRRGELVWPWGKWILWRRGLPGGAGDMRKLMVPCHSCYIYGTWRSKELGRRRI